MIEGVRVVLEVGVGSIYVDSCWGFCGGIYDGGLVMYICIVIDIRLVVCMYMVLEVVISCGCMCGCCIGF